MSATAIAKSPPISSALRPERLRQAYFFVPTFRTSFTMPTRWASCSTRGVSHDAQVVVVGDCLEAGGARSLSASRCLGEGKQRVSNGE